MRYTVPFALGGLDTEINSGVEIRNDDISPVGLYHTQNRVRLTTVRQDEITQTSYSAYVSHGIAWSSKFKTTLGLRADYFDFDVKSSLSANSGTASDSIVSPKLTMVYEPWTDVQFFLNAGEGFHATMLAGRLSQSIRRTGSPRPNA